MRFLPVQGTDLAWGLVQSVSVIVLLASAVWHWAHERRLRSMTCTLVGAFASSFLIRSTKPMASDYSQPVGVTIVTVVTMSLLQGLLVAYLGTEAEWSNWRVDFGLGSMAGISLAVAQGLACQGPPWINIILHTTALAAAGVLMLLGIRKLKEQTLTSALASALLLSIVATLLARAMGYQLILK